MSPILAPVERTYTPGVSMSALSHAFVCNRASGRTQRHQALNEVIARSFASAGIPVSKEPTGIYRDSVKRPDGVTLVPWQSGRAMAWDVTEATTLAESYLPASSATAAAAAEAAASRKEVKYSISQPHSHFSQLRWRHWDRSMNQLLTSCAS